MRPETDEIQMHEEDGVLMYSVARPFRNGFCGVCCRDAPEMREIEMAATHAPGKPETHRVTTAFICTGCLYRIAALDDPRKELFCGVIQDAAP